jgi:predicted tellurium resistance membrane protein TerC
MHVFLTADGLIALVTLMAMEIVPGIDNVVFLANLVGRLPDPTTASRTPVTARGLTGRPGGASSSPSRI